SSTFILFNAANYLFSSVQCIRSGANIADEVVNVGSEISNAASIGESTAESITEENIEMQNLFSPPKPLTHLGTFLLRFTPRLFTTGEEDLIHVYSPEDFHLLQEHGFIYGNKTNIIFTAALLKQKPLSVAKLETVVRANEILESNKYRQAFRSLMDGLDLSANTVINSNMDIDNLFPEEKTIAIVLTRKKTVLLEKRNDLTFKLSMFSSNTSSDIYMSHDEANKLFFGEGTLFSIYEYYHIQ
ncbi:MAG: hypothetical protein OXC48_07120, partial [Endozoicomonadaceae bacterium]|nr:hypothetical protein [Endozoicomonadaceae bacterium]